MSAGILEPASEPFRGDATLTRTEFCRWLDRLIGSPPIPSLPDEVRRHGELWQQRHAITDKGWVPQTPADPADPDRFGLLADLEDPDDTARVHRLVWWLILRPPQYNATTDEFLPHRSVNWNEFIVCLDRAAQYVDPVRPDASTPEGSLDALKLAFWHADFGTMERYVAAEPTEESGITLSLRREARTIRFAFADAQEFVDSKVSAVEHLSDGCVRVQIDYIPQWGDHDTETCEMEEAGDHWEIVKIGN